MKVKAVVEIFTESYAEEQFIMSRFPGAWFTPTSEHGKTLFYVPYTQYEKVKESINEWENANGKRK